MDTEGYLNELFHISQQQASQQLTGLKSCWIGTIVKALPDGTVMVANPLAGPMPTAQEQVDPNGNPTGSAQIYGPMQLCTSFAGCTSGLNTANSSVVPGIQMMPFGGSSENEPTKGEMVLVLNLNNDIGYCTCALMLFNNMALAPGANAVYITQAPIQPGEWLFVNPTGTQIYIDIHGNFSLYSMQPPPQLDQPAKAGGNVNIFATGLGADGVAGGAITLQTGLINTFPTPAELPGDIWLRSLSNIEMRCNDFGIESVFQVNIVADTTLNFDGHIAANLQSSDGEINLLAATDVDITAANEVNIVSVNLMSNAQWAQDLTLSGANNVVINGQDLFNPGNGGDISLNAVRNLNMFAGNNVLLTSDAGFMNLTANHGVINIQANEQDLNMGALLTNTNIVAFQQVNIASQNGSINIIAGINPAVPFPENINLVAQFGFITFNSGAGQPILFGAGQNAVFNVTNNYMINTGGAPVAPTTGQNILMNSGNGIVMSTGGTIGTPPTGPDIDLNAVGDIFINAGINATTGVGNLVLKGYNSVLIQAQSTSGTPEAPVSIKAAGLMEIESQFGNVAISAADSLQVSTITGALTIKSGAGGSLTLNSIIDSGTTGNINLEAQGEILLQNTLSGNALQAMLTAAFLDAFNAHTHMAGATGPPDTKLAHGNPLETVATQAN